MEVLLDAPTIKFASSGGLQAIHLFRSFGCVGSGRAAPGQSPPGREVNTPTHRQTPRPHITYKSFGVFLGVGSVSWEGQRHPYFRRVGELNTM